MFLSRNILLYPIFSIKLFYSFPFDNAGGTRFAKCFICNESGHLSKNCPKNTHGIYPKVHIYILTISFTL